MKKFSLYISFLSLSLSLATYRLDCYLTLAPSDFPQGIQARPLPLACNPHLPHLLVADASIWAISLLGVVVKGRIRWGFSPLPVYVAFFLLRDGFDHCLLYSLTNLCT